jgi:PKD repeat protein
MKRIILITGIALTLFASCEREHHPVADFSVSTSVALPGESIYFTNLSHYVGRCEWNFGDGYKSTEFNPTHYYTSTGTYHIQLSVFNDVGSDIAYMDIVVDIADPVALFTTDYSLVTPNEIVFFDNLSSNAEHYEWDFGDGYVSSDINPSHFYKREGVYTVELAAYNGDKVDYYYKDIEVYATTLEVEVRDYETNELISGIDITLYDTYNDWYDLVNPIISAPTDNSGVVVFKNLDTKSYYIDAYSTFYDNEQLGLEDIGFIKTLPLVYAAHNVFIAKVDYYPQGKANSGDSRTRKPVIRELKRVYKEKNAEVKLSK